MTDVGEWLLSLVAGEDSAAEAVKAAMAVDVGGSRERSFENLMSLNGFNFP